MSASNWEEAARLAEFQQRYHTPQEILTGLVKDYDFKYVYEFRSNYDQVLGGDHSLANILGHKQGVCQQFALLVAAGMENKGYRFGIMVLLSKHYSNQPQDSDHELMVFQDHNGLWGYTSNEKYVGGQFDSLDELFYRDWSQKYSGYRYRDAKDFPAGWVSDEDLVFQAPAVAGPVLPEFACSSSRPDCTDPSLGVRTAIARLMVGISGSIPYRGRERIGEVIAGSSDQKLIDGVLGFDLSSVPRNAVILDVSPSLEVHVTETPFIRLGCFQAFSFSSFSVGAVDFRTRSRDSLVDWCSDADIFSPAAAKVAQLSRNLVMDVQRAVSRSSDFRLLVRPQKPAGNDASPDFISFGPASKLIVVYRLPGNGSSKALEAH